MTPLLTPEIDRLTRDLLDALRAKRIMAVTAESCTGGLIAACLTQIAGSSDVVDRGFVTYSNEAKIDHVFVGPQTLQAHGAVSEQTAGEMAVGAIRASRAGLSIAVTGIAGPGGGSADKPVGLVFIATALKDGKTVVTKSVFGGDRHAVRLQTVETALRQAIAMLDQG